MKRCKACLHVDYKNINKDLLILSDKAVAIKYGLSRQCVQRHRNNCVTTTLSNVFAAKESRKSINAVVRKTEITDKEKEKDGIGLLEEIELLINGCKNRLLNVDKDGDYFSGINAALRCFEMVGKLTGELRENSVNITNVQAVQVVYPWEIEE